MTVMKFSQARSDFDSSNLCKNCENLWSYLNRESVFCSICRYKSFSNMAFRPICFIRMGIKGGLHTTKGPYRLHPVLFRWE